MTDEAVEMLMKRFWRCMRLLSDIAWIILLTITPWWLFERLLLSDCERAVCKRLEALKDGKGD